MEQSALCEKAISFCTQRCAIESFKQTILPVLYLIIPRLCPKNLKDFRIKLCALRSRSKKVLNTEAQKGWSTLAKESQEIPTFSTGTKSTMGQKPFQYSTTNDWNLLPKRQRSIDNLNTFKSKIYVLSFLKQTKLTISVRSNGFTG